VSSETFDRLRKRAEELLKQRPDSSQVSANEDVRDLIHELKVHQKELEIQNEELKESQQELASLHKEEDDTLVMTMILFKIKDTGQGIDPENLPRIFDSYDQGDHNSDSADQGAGLGLAICKKLSQEMGGSIWADSQPGKGSIFFVRIPLRTDGEMAEQSEACSSPESHGDLPPQHILLVEDQRMNQIFTVDLLTSHGHQVEVVQNGQQALDRLGKKSFDLVLMHIKMPVMDGIEATKRIRTSDPIYLNPEIPVIGLSAHVPSKEEQERFQSAGFDKYIIQPVSFESLFAAMEDLLDGQAGSSYPEQ
jgi:CheY-like chemotaxis protein